MKQRNNHARYKRKRKLLRLKNRQRASYEKSLAKINRANAPKGRTFVRPNAEVGAKDVAIPLHALYPDGDIGFYFDPGHRRNLNQRQRRKRWRIAPHTRRA